MYLITAIILIEKFTRCILKYFSYSRSLPLNCVNFFFIVSLIHYTDPVIIQIWWKNTFRDISQKILSGGKNKNKHSNHSHAKYTLEKEPCVSSTELFVWKRVNWHFPGDRLEQSILDYHWKNRRHPIQWKLRACRHFSKLTRWDMAIQHLKSHPL